MTTEQTKVQQRVSAVLARITKTCVDDADEAICYASALDQMLEDLLSEDFFGTEGTTDPRGDQREGPWRVESRVEGIDN